MGHYSFIIEVDNENPELHPNMSTIKEIDLYLKVIKVPEVMFMNPRRRLLHRYYIANQIHDLKANINGFKIDRSSLQWTFRYSYSNIFSSNKIVLKISFSLCFWAPDLLFDRF